MPLKKTLQQQPWLLPQPDFFNTIGPLCNDRRGAFALSRRRFDPESPMGLWEYNILITPDQLRVFLCHSSDDKASVRSIYQRLRADGFAPWLDEECLIPGQQWETEIRNAVRNSHVVLVCLSQKSTNKEGYVQKEIKYALDVADEKPENTIFLIPLRLELCTVPERLRQWQWVDALAHDWYEKLTRALQARAQSLGIAIAKYRSAAETEFFSCFISYSADDRDFAERLNAELQKNGVSCWFAPENLKTSDPFRQRTAEAISHHDKLLLILSEHSVQSDWVREEVEACLESERQQQRQILFIIRLDEAVMRTGQAWAAAIRRRRHIGDFSNRSDHDGYQRAFQRLLRDLRGDFQ